MYQICDRVTNDIDLQEHILPGYRVLTLRSAKPSKQLQV